MFEDLLASLDSLDAFDVQEATLDELEDLCTHPVFRLLCDTCERLFPRSGPHGHHHHSKEESCRP